jgi:hypothetical protein
MAQLYNPRRSVSGGNAALINRWGIRIQLVPNGFIERLAKSERAARQHINEAEATPLAICDLKHGAPNLHMRDGLHRFFVSSATGIACSREV